MNGKEGRVRLKMTLLKFESKKNGPEVSGPVQAES